MDNSRRCLLGHYNQHNGLYVCSACTLESKTGECITKFIDENDSRKSVFTGYEKYRLINRLSDYSISFESSGEKILKHGAKGGHGTMNKLWFEIDETHHDKCKITKISDKEKDITILQQENNYLCRIYFKLFNAVDLDQIGTIISHFIKIVISIIIMQPNKYKIFYIAPSYSELNHLDKCESSLFNLISNYDKHQEYIMNFQQILISNESELLFSKLNDNYIGDIISKTIPNTIKRETLSISKIRELVSNNDNQIIGISNANEHSILFIIKSSSTPRESYF